MPEKKLAAFVGAPGPPSEPAARRTCQPVSARAPLRARATCAEPPRGKKNSAEQTRPATGPLGRAGRAPFSPSPRSAILLRFGRGAGDSCLGRAAAATTRTTLPAAGPTNRQEANAKYRSVLDCGGRGSVGLWLLELDDERTPAEARDHLLTLATAVVR
jgi:hypothetical protein